MWKEFSGNSRLVAYTVDELCDSGYWADAWYIPRFSSSTTSTSCQQSPLLSDPPKEQSFAGKKYKHGKGSNLCQASCHYSCYPRHLLTVPRTQSTMRQYDLIVAVGNPSIFQCNDSRQDYIVYTPSPKTATTGQKSGLQIFARWRLETVVCALGKSVACL